MKLLLYLLILALISFISCSKENNQYEDTGFLSISLGININESDADFKSTDAYEDFTLTIFNLEGDEIISFQNVSEIPPFIELKTGEYFAVAHSKNLPDIAFENPYYLGTSENFTIVAGQTITTELNCSLANCAVSIKYSDLIKSSFTDYSTVVSSNSGSLVFNKDELRKGYFSLEPITIRATLSYTINNEIRTKVLNGTISSPEAGKHYEIVLDAKLTNGLSSFNISVDSTETIQQVNYTEETGLLITEIMFNPTSIDDARGEWFEVYNNSGDIINLNGLTIIRGPSKHLINTDVILNPGDYYVLARTDTAYNGEKYVYSSTFNLVNTNSVLAIYKISGSDSVLFARVPYASPDFPAASGASISLNPERFNVNDSNDGSSWCVSSSVYNTGDLGTPGLPNDVCN